MSNLLSNTYCESCKFFHDEFIRKHDSCGRWYSYHHYSCDKYQIVSQKDGFLDECEYYVQGKNVQLTVKFDFDDE